MDLTQLAALIRRRNALDAEIAALIGRPAPAGPIGGFISSRTRHRARGLRAR